MKRIGWLVLWISFVLVLVGCRPSVTEPAMVGEKIITQKQWQEQMLLTKIRYDLSQTTMPEDGEAHEQLKKDVLDNMVEDLVLLEEAEERTITADVAATGDEARILLEAIYKHYGEEPLVQLLESYDANKEDLDRLILESATNNHIVYQLFIQVTKDAQVTQEEMVDYYDQHGKEFDLSTVHAKGWIFTDEGTASEVEKKVQTDPAKVDEWLATYKDQEGVYFSGDFGPAFYTDLAPDFADALFNEPVGEWTPLVKTDPLIYLGYVYGKETYDPIPLEEVKDRVEQRVLSEKQAALYESFLKDAFEKREIQVHYDKL